MWFNSLQIYQCTLETPSQLSEALQQDILKPCPPHARFIYGWLTAFNGQVLHEVAGCAVICLGKEERILPRGVIQRMLVERIQQIEIQRGYPVKRAERLQMAEELEFELLPKSFCVQKRLYALFDFVTQRLYINTPSANQASQLISLMRKSVSGITLEPISYSENMAMQFVNWIQQPASLPANFQLASGCQLFSPDDDKKRFNCKGYELPAEEVLSLLSQGLLAAELSLIWNERIQFTLTHNFTFKRLKCLDYLAEDFNEIRQLNEDEQQQDAALTLLSGEIRAMLTDLQAYFAKAGTPSTQSMIADCESA